MESNRKGFDIFVRKAVDILEDNDCGYLPEYAYFDLSKFNKMNSVAIDPDQYQ